MSKKLTRRFPTTHYDTAMDQSGAIRDLMKTTRDAWGQVPDQHSFRPTSALLSLGYRQSEALMIEAMFWYEQFGQQNYVVGPALQDVFRHTHLKGVTADAVRLPYPCFFVVLEDCPVQIWGGPRTQWHQVAGFYMWQNVDGDLFFNVWGKPNARSTYALDDASCWMRFRMEEVFSEHPDLESYIHHTLTESPPVYDLDESPPDQNQSYMVLARIAFNLVLYLQSRSSETETETPASRRADFRKRFGKANPKKGAAKLAARDLEKAGQAVVTWVGRSIEATGQVSLTDAKGLLRRHWVPGHWQRYWVGSGEEKKASWRFKAPYERCKDTGVAIERRFSRFREKTGAH